MRTEQKANVELVVEKLLELAMGQIQLAELLAGLEYLQLLKVVNSAEGQLVYFAVLLEAVPTLR